jgi:GH15 family glucan-1,4-alpha-glucosidase
MGQRPDFDSPSVFCRILDQHKGGHFSIAPHKQTAYTTKQHYVSNTNILNTRFMNEAGVVNLEDFFPRPKHNPPRPGELKKWLVRRVECLRGAFDLELELFPAFNYARDSFITEILNDQGITYVLFRSKSISLRLDVVIESGEHHENTQRIFFKKEASQNGLGDGITANFMLKDGDIASFVLRDLIAENEGPIYNETIDLVTRETTLFWSNWIGQGKYSGRYREYVARSLLILKMLTYEPTGAIVAAPTFSLPEDLGGHRNWDYRYSWVRDSSFTIYILLRMGYRAEAEAYVNFIGDRLLHSRLESGALPIMFGIRGEANLEELELDHLEGYRGSKPVRIGNGAASHVQLDIYGELMDGLYLYNKYGNPVSLILWHL